MTKAILVVVGPTAVGKTELAVDVARKLDAEIISADSMQVYRGMDVGTAKPTVRERGGIAHHLIDVIDPTEDFTVAQYQQLAEEAIIQITDRGRVPLLTGGTGLYVRAVIDGFDFPGEYEDLSLREEMQRFAEEHGNAALHQRLRQVDPAAAARLHPNDRRRVIRALEVYELTGIPLSQHLRGQSQRPARHEAVMFGLTRPRPELYARCDQRVEIMLRKGLLAEVKSLLSMGFDHRTTALQAIGYKELVGYLQGEYDWDEATRLLKRNTRRYAKRQYTWFMRDQRISWIDLGSMDSGAAVQKIVSEYKRKVLSDTEN